MAELSAAARAGAASERDVLLASTSRPTSAPDQGPRVTPADRMAATLTRRGMACYVKPIRFVIGASTRATAAADAR